MARIGPALMASLAVALVAVAAGAAVAEPVPGPSIVSHVKVVSDKVEDVSSLEAWRRSFIRDEMSDREKALAVWRSVVAFQHQDAPPSEFLQLESNVLDPIKMFNVYGYSYCSVASAHVQALARHIGLKARGWTINRHVVPDVFWDGKWHLLDASLINYFPKPDGTLAGVEEIVTDLKAWYAKHPDLKGNGAGLRKSMAGGGWRKGPDILSRCPFYDYGGWLPAATHGWYSTMQEYDGSTLFRYESGYSLGYRVNVQLRRGERLTRNWSNKGLHVMMDGGGTPGALKGRAGYDALRYTPRYGDLAPGRIGNGTLAYDVPLADASFRGGALVAANLACTSEAGAGPAVHVKDPQSPGVLVIRMPSSYVYLGGDLSVKAVVGPGGTVRVAFSDNNGLDYKPVATVTASGAHRIDLKPFVFRRYDYRLKFVLEGSGTGLDAVRLVHDVQHSQRPLPALAKGANTITFSAGPQEGTITIEGSTEPKNRQKQLLYTDFRPERQNIKNNLLVLSAGEGRVTFPVKTPGDMTRIRVGIFYRARDPRDSWDISVSFDGGKAFQPVGRCAGPTVSMGASFVVENVPPGTREALVRFAGKQRNTTMLYNVRIDADYAEPHGGFRPVRVTYVWEEGGQEKRHVHVAAKPHETYQINCAERPTMKRLTVELAE
jgi:hypothetical protein